MESRNLVRKANTNNKIEMTPFDTTMEAKFKDIQSDIEYKFSICTFINGKSISKRLITRKQKQN